MITVVEALLNSALAYSPLANRALEARDCFNCNGRSLQTSLLVVQVTFVVPRNVSATLKSSRKISRSRTRRINHSVSTPNISDLPPATHSHDKVVVQSALPFVPVVMGSRCLSEIGFVPSKWWKKLHLQVRRLTSIRWNVSRRFAYDP